MSGTFFGLTVAMDAVIESGAICQAAICYTGDVLDPKRTKYSLDYYVQLAKDLEKRGAHMLAIKDMAGRNGASVVDAAMAPFAELTSQPNLNAIVEAVRNTPLDTGLDPEPLRHLTHYWAAVRDHYTAFECGMKAPDADL